MPNACKQHIATGPYPSMTIKQMGEWAKVAAIYTRAQVIWAMDAIDKPRITIRRAG